MIKRLFFFTAFIFFAISTNAQVYSFGIKGGLSYTSYDLSNGYVFYNTDGNPLSFHAGIFAKRNISKFYLQAEVDFLTGMNGRINFRKNEHTFNKSSLSIPLIAGRHFYPGTTRIFVGLAPGIFFGEDEIDTFLRAHKLIAEGKFGTSTALSYLFGAGIDISKFTVDVRYEANLLGGFYYEDKNPNIRSYHRFSHITLSLGYKIQ